MTRPLVYTAVPTAFDEDGGHDLASTTRLFEHALAGGVDALFVNGTTAEFPALSTAERRANLRRAVEVAGADRVIAHVGAASPYDTRLLTADALELGIRRLSVLTPFYLPSSLDGVREQIVAARTLADDAEYFLYLFPDRTGVHVTPAQAAALIEEFDLAGAKVSIAGADYVSELAGALRSPRTLLSGNDGLMREIVAAGGAGVVSGVSSSVPRPFADLAAAMDAGDASEIERIAAEITAIVAVLGPSIAALKLSLAAQGVIANGACRMAIDPPTPDARRAVADVVSRIRTEASSPVA